MFKFFTYISYLIIFFILINWKSLNYWKWIVLGLGLIYEIYVNIYLRKNYGYRFGLTKEQRKQNLKAIEDSGILITNIKVGLVLILFLFGLGLYLIISGNDTGSGSFLVIFSAILMVVFIPIILKNKRKIS